LTAAGAALPASAACDDEKTSAQAEASPVQTDTLAAGSATEEAVAAPESAAADTSAAAEGAAPDTSAAAQPSAADTSAAEPTPAEAPGPEAGATVIYGTVSLADGTPLPQVTAALFAGGIEAATSVTDTSGAYSIVHPLDRTADRTVVLWFNPPRGTGLMREIVVLKESSAARKARQFGPCFVKVPLEDSTRVDVTILDQKAYAAKLEESGCVEQMAEAAPTFELAYALEKGDTLRIEVEAQETFTQKFGGTEQSSTISSKDSFVAVVDSLGPDGFFLTIEYGPRTVNTNDPRARGSIDFSPLVGKRVSALLSPRGELSTFRGFDALPEIEVGQGQTMTSQDYIDEIKHLFPFVPADPVEQGETWTEEYTISKSEEDRTSATTISATYTLAGETTYRDEACVEIDSEASITLKAQGTMRGSPFKMNATGTLTGKIYFAYDRNMMLERTQEGKLEGTVESMGMTIPITRQSESRVSIELP